MDNDDTIPADEFMTDEEIAEMCAKSEQAEWDMLTKRIEQEAAQAEQEQGDKDDSDSDEDGFDGYDELTERRREYHDMLDRDFQRLGMR